ncbi:MAG: ketopantoate reductase family protein [Megasphaera sp.]|jgi:2-dehydropantoate 2-reductase|nr:ketopantoate reductase family protein [Megasphaera sp.]MCH4187889.1 ketopantoate reductase family protein [Megasphaera sp.]MCH4218484.1 ketopantoate reductase family protein [Megasphaera sp.]
MKLMVSGIGGVGGYISAVLCAHYDTVTLVARHKRKEALQRGLVLHSLRMGERIFHPAVTDTPANAGIQDIIFICTKNFSLPDALQALLPCIDEHTIIVPIMNGIDHADTARRICPTGHVVNAFIYITSSYKNDYSIFHPVSYAHVFISARIDAIAKQVQSILQHTNELDCTIPDDMDAEIWKKYITNCAYNTITAYYICTTRYIVESPQRIAEFRALLTESYQVGITAGIHLPSTLPNDIFDRFAYHRDLDMASSMERDAANHKQTELETFSGHLVRLAHTLHVPVPVTERFYKTLKEREDLQ